MKPESTRPITIEDLLRLKRAERPPTEFWATFDRELRAKQLAALVEKRPWWQTWPKTVSRVVRYRVTIGATAVAIVAFFSVRETQPAGTAGDSIVQVDPVGIEVDEETSPSGEHFEPASPAVQVAADLATAVQLPATSIISDGPQVATVPETSHALPIAGSGSAHRVADSESPAGRRIAENLAVLQAGDVGGSRSLLGVASGFEVRAMPSRVAVEPLQQMTPPSDSRRARLLTAMVSMASLESSLRTTERAASRIAEERLYDDQISRFGARGDRLQVKF